LFCCHVKFDNAFPYALILLVVESHRMTVVADLNKTLLLSRSELLAAIEADAATAAGVSLVGASPAVSVEGLLVRVTVPKREWERLVVAVLPFVAVGASPTEHIDPTTDRGKTLAKKQSELRSLIEKGSITSFCRVGALKSVVFHVAAPGQAPTPYFLVDLGDCEETFTAKQVHDRPQEAADDELTLHIKLQSLFGKRAHSMEQHRVLSAAAAGVRQRVAASSSAPPQAGIAPGQFKLTTSGTLLHSDASATSSAEIGSGGSSSLVLQQRELIQQLKQALEQKNRDLYQTTLQMRAYQQQSDERAKELSAQIQSLADLNRKQMSEHEAKEGKMKLLVDTVRPLHALLKLAREKLSIPQGSPEEIERALREATVVPRAAPAS
jgi:hypothetical protein